MNTGNLADSSTANYQYAMASFMIKSQLECFNKCLVDFRVRDIQAMEQMCTDSCINKMNVAVQEMQSAEYQKQFF